MSNTSASPLTASPLALTTTELQARVQSLDSEILLLRSQLEEQSWRMAQLVLENAALKADAGATRTGNTQPHKPKRNPAAIVSREEVEYALSMGRGALTPPAR